MQNRVVQAAKAIFHSTPLTRYGWLENKSVKGSVIKRPPQRLLNIFQKTKTFNMWRVIFLFSFLRYEPWEDCGLDGLTGGRTTPLAEDGWQSWDSCRGYTHASFQHGEASALKVPFSKMRHPETVWLSFSTSSRLGSWTYSSLAFLTWGH